MINVYFKSESTISGAPSGHGALGIMPNASTVPSCRHAAFRRAEFLHEQGTKFQTWQKDCFGYRRASH